MARLDLTVFGGFLARIRGEPLTLPTKKIQALLAYLALPVGHAHQRDKLANLLWGGTPDASARNSFRQALFVLRKALASSGDVLRIEGDTLALDRDAVEVDAMAFERAVADGMPAALEKAATLYCANSVSSRNRRQGNSTETFSSGASSTPVKLTCRGGS